MTILIVANTSWYIHNFRSRLIAALILLGHRVVVLSPRDNFTERIESLGARHVHLELDNSGTNPMREVLTLSRLISHLRTVHPDLIFTFTPKINIYVSLAARVVRIPVVTNVSGLGSGFLAGGWLKSVMVMLYRIAFRHPFRVFFQNNEDRQEFIHSGLVDARKTSCLPGSGVDLQKFAPGHHLNASSLVFLMVARLLWDKGVAEYVQAARLLKVRFPQAKFLLLGPLNVQNPSAVPLSQVALWCEEGVVEYLGFTDDVRPYYAGCDCVVLPSYYREGVPRSLLEAAATGLPVIAADVPGSRDAVEHEVTGLLCRPRDAQDLATAMERMILMPESERVSMGMAGRTKMEREFDERIVIDAYLQIVAEIGRET